MKKFIYLIMLSLFTVAFYGCVEDYEDGEITIISPYSRVITIPKLGGSGVLTFKSSHKWEITIDYTNGSDWLTIPFSSDKVVGNNSMNIVASANPTTDERRAKLVISMGPISQEINVLQAGLTEREPLVALYNATGGENWKNNTHWCSNAPIGEWYGVEINEEGKVSSLNLGRNQLTGSLPAEIGELTKLESFNCSYNYLNVDDLPESIISHPHYENWELTPQLDREAIEQDRQALIAFYNATGGNNWRFKANWCSYKPLNEWHDVRTNEVNNVSSTNCN